MEKILVIGACGQIGVELTLSLRNIYGNQSVIASDIRDENELLKGTGPYFTLDATNHEGILQIVRKEKITQIYLLAALLSATAEKDPQRAWEINMRSLLQVLDIAVQEKLNKIYWPSSIAVFGATTPKDLTPQHTIIEPQTVYGISKYAGELWCQYYYQRWGLDVRSLRYPGIISWKTAPGGGTTDYAVEIYHEALKQGHYKCFLEKDAYLPMMYMDDAIRATIELMEAPAQNLSTHLAYNVAAMSFSPQEIAESIRKHLPHFEISYAPDFRQKIAAGWPKSIDDSLARNDWGWQPQFDLAGMTEDMLLQLGKQIG